MDKEEKNQLYVAYKKATLNIKTNGLKVKGWKKIFHANGTQKRTGVTILISNKIDFKIKTITRDKNDTI